MASHAVSLEPEEEYLMRCDRVDFPPAGIDYTHTQAGPGTRCLLQGELRVTVQRKIITANPAIYRTKGDDLPELLRMTRPYYFNDPEKRHKEEIVPGFETRIRGFTADEYVAAVQRQIGIELESIVDQPDLTDAGGGDHDNCFQA